MRHAMNRSRLGSRILIPGLFLIVLMLTGLVQAAPSVDLILTPSHSPPEFSFQPPLYDYGEPVMVNVTLMNHGPRAITVMGYPPNRGISHRNQTDFLAFHRSSVPVTIGAGENLTFDFSWDQKDAQGLQVEPGLYTLAVYYLWLFSNFRIGFLNFFHLDNKHIDTRGPPCKS